MDNFEVGDVVTHNRIPGKKFKIIDKLSPSRYEIEDLTNKSKYVEPIDELSSIIESRDRLINFIIDE